VADPTNSGHLAATAAKSAASGGATAALLPFDPITMAVGLVAALVALLHITPPEGQARTPVSVFLMVAGSAFLAGVFVPVAVAGGTNYLPWLAGVGDRPLQLAAAAVIGALPHVAPLIWRLWRETKGAQR
jgi:hypothetical protein